MKPTHPIFFRSSCPWKRSHLAKYGAIHKIMDSLNMYFLKQTYSTHNWNIKLEWIVILFHKTTLYHAFTQHQGTEWRRKYFNILSSSSSESFWRSWSSPDSWVKFSILSLPFLYFCCLALMRSILYNKTPAAMPRTHPQLPIHLCTQPTPTVTYTLMHTAYTHSYLYTFVQTAKIVDSVATFGTCGWLLVSNNCLLVSFILPGFAFFFKKKMLPTSYSCEDQMKRHINVRTVLYIVSCYFNILECSIRPRNSSVCHI